MYNHRQVGPLYCETPGFDPGVDVYDGLAAFPLEPINVLTSVFPALVGLFLLWYLYQKRELTSILIVLATATLVVGVGSVLWHGLRTPLTLYLDWMPGFFAFIVFMFIWPMYLKNRWWGYGSLVAVFGGTYLFAAIAARLVESNGPPTSLFFVVTAVAGVLLYVTWREYGRLVWWGVAMLAFAIVAAFSRTVDLSTCGTFEHFGTHAFWHIGLGTASLLGTIMLLKIKAHREQLVLK